MRLAATCPHRSLRTIALAALSVGVALTPAAVEARGKPRVFKTYPTAIADPRAEAQRLVKEGRALHDSGDLPGALDRFERAYGLMPVPKMLYNLGITYQAVGRADRAVCVLERFLFEAEKVEAALRDDARARVKDASELIGRVEVSAPPGAALYLDGEEQAWAPLVRPLCATPGPHRVAALAPGLSPVGVQVDVGAGAVTPVVFEGDSGVVKVGTPTVPGQPAADLRVAAPIGAVTPLVAAAPAKEPLYKKWWLWTTIGGVVTVGAVTGGVLATQLH